MSLDESRTEDVPQLSAADNDILVAPFSEKEVFDAIAQMKNNKAPGPMDSRQSSIKSAGTLLRGIYHLCSMICFPDSFNYFT